MAKSLYQGKIIRHFYKTSGLQTVTWGGCLNYCNDSLNINNTSFFHYDIRAG